MNMQLVKPHISYKDTFMQGLEECEKENLAQLL